MLDIRKAKPAIAYEFTLPTAYAVQCVAGDPNSTDFYVAQADKSSAVEDLLISRNVKGASVRMKQASYMRLVGGGHGTTVSVLTRNGELGIVCNAWGDLVWVPYQAGKTLRKGDPSIVSNFWPASYAYIDHQAGTVCLRSGSGFTLRALQGDKLGAQIGKTVPTSQADSSGPFQGYCSLKAGEEFQLFTTWDYGSTSSKPTIVSASFTTGLELYGTTARILDGKVYRTTQEPESAFGLDGDFYLGMSTRGSRGKIPMAVKLVMPVGEPPVTPPPVVVPPVTPPTPKPVRVTMWVRPLGDPIWDKTSRVHTMSPRTSAKVSKLDTVKRKPGFKVTGNLVTVDGVEYVEVKSKRLYRKSYLTSRAPK